MNIPDEITHEGKILVRLSDINDAREGDYAMISGKLEPVRSISRRIYINGTPLNVLERYIQAAYREKQAEAHEWIPEAAKLTMNCAEFCDVWERTNEYLTATYGSPEALMRKGAEQAIQLDNSEWRSLNKVSECGISLDCHHAIHKLVRQALANFHQKEGAK